MWQTETPSPVKLIVGILAADADALSAAREAVCAEFGTVDMESEIWSFTQTDYYKDETGEHILRQFVTFEHLIDPGRLAAIKHTTNRIEQDLAQRLQVPLPRPVNLDPGYLEPAKLVLASTKNFSHRIYIGDTMYAEVTLTYSKGAWQATPFTFPDYRQGRYHAFLDRARQRLIEQRRQSSNSC
ncbi:MAG: DUF4416 family protein [Sedimentisphaerales bacterium]|nr:DUF4416 family protein [Sedimentisphaerales bacterium]